MVKNTPAMQETWVRSLGWEDPLEEGMATLSRILAWRTPWAEEPLSMCVCWVRICSWRRGKWSSLPFLLESFNVQSICFLSIFQAEGLRNEKHIDSPSLQEMRRQCYFLRTQLRVKQLKSYVGCPCRQWLIQSGCVAVTQPYRMELISRFKYQPCN